MKERRTLSPQSPKGTKRRHASDETRNIPVDERATTQSEVHKSEHAYTGDELIGRNKISPREEQSRREGPDYGSQTNQNGRRNMEDAPQLQRWAYEVSNANITFTERLEKSRWEAGRS